jgi:L-aspartate oxidase
MSLRAGVLRSGDGLAEAAAALAAGAGAGRGTGPRHGAGAGAGRGAGAGERSAPQVSTWEASNMHLVAGALVAAAAARQETRGSHWREDYPQPADGWRGHLITVLGPDGLRTWFEPPDEFTAGAGGRPPRTARHRPAGTEGGHDG